MPPTQVSLYFEEPDVEAPAVDHSLLKDYIAYARAHIHPVLSEEVSMHAIRSRRRIERYETDPMGAAHALYIIIT